MKKNLTPFINWLTRKRALLLLAALMIAGGGAAAYLRRRGAFLKRPNILVVSTCSLRWDFMDSGRPPPHLQEFFRRSTIFENAYTGKSWSNVSGFLFEIPRDIYEANGYHAIGLPWPEIKKKWAQKKPPTYFIRAPSNFSHPDYWSDLQQVKTLVSDREHWPFLLEYHIKMAHEPYAFADWNHGRLDALAFLSPEKRAYLDTYFKHPEQFPERVFLSILLEAHSSEKAAELLKRLPIKIDPEIADRYARSAAPVLIGLISNPQLAELWRRSPYFAKDLEIVKEVYRFHIHYLDDYLAQLLELFSDPQLAQNTVIIFTGDHGEAFGEHGEFGHGQTNYDEMLHFPLAVHFPGDTKTQVISKQIYQGSIATMVKAIMNGTLTRSNFSDFIEHQVDDSYIISNNCATTEFGIRHANRWKLILNPATNARQLFDLKSDPAEKLNVDQANPEVSAGLEEYLLNHLANFPFNKIISRCAGEL